MNTNNSLAAFWRAYTVAGGSTKLLPGETVPAAPDPVADAVHAYELLDNTLLAVSEPHP